MHRFYIAPDMIEGNVARIDKEQARHIEKVLRLKSRDTITAFDGLGYEYLLQIMGRENNCLLAEIIDKVKKDNESNITLSLVQGMAKGDKMDLIIQKAVELGISSIYPLASENSVVRLEGDKADKKVGRWQAIAREACKQCRRNTIPCVHEPLILEQVLDMIDSRTAIMMYENEDKTALKAVLKDNRDRLLNSEIMLIIGPEGGFSSSEVERAREKGVFLAGLGPRILRTETAGIAASSIIMYELGDLG